jgi:hypothetical protein
MCSLLIGGSLAAHAASVRHRHSHIKASPASRVRVTFGHWVNCTLGVR